MRIAAGTVIAEKYRLEAQIARGGMGAVWLARHVKLGSQLAVKFLDPKLAASATFVARFEREARAAATIESPHVVHVHDFGLEDGVPYLVMELLRGEDLRTRLRKKGRLSMTETADLLTQVGKALRRAHEAGIVHRDIKPGNLFLARIEDQEVLKVLDFGIAKEPNKSLGDQTRTGEIIGTAHYVSPEQARGDKDVDHRTDVWSVGVIAYRMLTGRLPFPGDGFGNVLAKVLTEPPPPVRSMLPSLPESLDAFFARALAKKREERFQSVRELVDAFMDVLRSEALAGSVVPPSWSSIHRVSLPSGDLTVLELTPDTPSQAPEKPDDEPTDPDDISARSDRRRLDSLSPQATNPGDKRANIAIRLRWIAVIVVFIVGVGAALGMWIREEHTSPVAEPAPSAQEAPSRLGAPVSPDPVATAEPPKTAPPPSSETATSAAKTSTTKAPPAPLPIPPTSSPTPRATGSGTTRKWGF